MARQGLACVIERRPGIISSMYDSYIARRRRRAVSARRWAV